ncbi:MAG: chemotaxis protein CheW [Gammaproteobacteria bacterium]|uniref:chemotaxis protein CheW n=1 Tax=Pseudomaricurvus alcaniphilus TaxID=1166482 RepID=UPI00140E3CFF|nr:chemotaxis protein CheW [Pseudomaricurvus alcaniphilus]MBR9912224.1 chemotaxis protein CheW [Gammaproteobacteria bacterium]NHN38712.1 chemotaxis protein CheW [Pseudomaricurvus alcaniphilus]
MTQNSLQSRPQPAPESLPGLMIPLASRVLLVPTVAVAEIVAYLEPLPVDPAPAWLLGDFPWRGQRVPLLSLELLSGEPAPPLQATTRVAVFNNTGVSTDLPFIAIATEGIPKLVQVSEQDLQASDNGPRSFESARLVWQGEELVIPDLSALERACLDCSSSNG